MRPESINFCPRCGQPVERALRFGSMRPVCSACNWLHFADPKVAAGVLVAREDKYILLVQRANAPQRGLWTVPAGFVNADEDPAEAAVRECLEETGLNVHITGLLQIIHGREHERGADFVIFYSARAEEGKIQAGDDASDANWFSRNSLPPLAFRATRIILNQNN